MQEQGDERISVRFETNMISEIDALVKEMGYPNRSEFFRTAVRAQIENQQQEDAISVTLTPLNLDHIDELVKRGFYKSREDALEKAIDGFFTPEIIEKNLKTAGLMEIGAGKKFEVGLESDPSRQIVTK